MKDVAIVVTTHDRPVWLHEALASIHEAAHGIRLQLIVVDDASATLAARPIAHEFGAIYLRLGANVGLARARVIGLNRVDAEFHAFWDDDDVMLPSWFERHLALTDKADVVSGSYYRADADLRNWREKRLAPVTLADLRAGRVSANDMSLVRASAMLPMRPEMGTAAPMTLWLEMAAAGRRFATVAELTWLYRQHPGSMHAAVRDAELRRQAVAVHG